MGFLVDVDGSFFFLEMNTRLQVEHPVTEMVTGADLVGLQIQIAEGRAIRDLWNDIEPAGHAIEARLYAEDTANNFLPATGTVHVFDVPDSVRVDSGVESGSEVSIFYDPMLAKLIAHGPDRDVAIRVLTSALRASRIHGVTTNRALLVRILEHDDFAGARADTAWLESLDASALGTDLAGREELEHMALAASMVLQYRRRRNTPVLRTLPSGFRNNPSQLTVDRYVYGERDLSISYTVAGDTVKFAVDGEQRPEATLVSHADDNVRLRIGTLDQTFTVETYEDRVFVDTKHVGIQLVRLARLPIPKVALDPGSLVSPMPGKVVRVEVSVGDQVASGDTLVVAEAMKMEHTIAAPHDGTVGALPVSAGYQVVADEVLAIVDPG